LVRDETLAELGESQALGRTVSRLKPSQFELVGSGDDAALVMANGAFLVSTDTLVENHDFRLDFSSGFDLGFKAVATNLADIAAMGGTPTALVVAVVAPPNTKISFLEDFADGLQAACDELSPGVGVVGGDLAAGENLIVSVTVHGQMAEVAAVLRTGAKPGDSVAVCGTLGHAACGLELLLSGKPELVSAYDDFVISQLRPRPPVNQGVIAARAGASAMLDVSDGLITDAWRIAKASGVSIELAGSELKGYEAMLELPAQALGINPEQWVLQGGEDHALLATFPPQALLPRSFKVIGKVAESDSPAVYLDGKIIEGRGWDSIRGRE